MTDSMQPGILAGVPSVARYLSFSCRPGADAAATRGALQMLTADEDKVLGIGEPFGKSLDAFEVQLRRMVGLDDGIPDAPFSFSQPANGACYWCPPVKNEQLDLG